MFYAILISFTFFVIVIQCTYCYYMFLYLYFCTFSLHLQDRVDRPKRKKRPFLQKKAQEKQNPVIVNVENSDDDSGDKPNKEPSSDDRLKARRDSGSNDKQTRPSSGEKQQHSRSKSPRSSKDGRPTSANNHKSVFGNVSTFVYVFAFCVCHVTCIYVACVLCFYVCIMFYIYFHIS